MSIRKILRQSKHSTGRMRSAGWRLHGIQHHEVNESRCLFDLALAIRPSFILHIGTIKPQLKSHTVGIFSHENLVDYSPPMLEKQFSLINCACNYCWPCTLSVCFAQKIFSSSSFCRVYVNWN